MSGNLSTTLRPRRRACDPMAADNRLPSAAREWTCQVVLPWCAASVARLWRKAMAATGGCEAAARDWPSAAERARLARDALSGR